MRKLRRVTPPELLNLKKGPLKIVVVLYGKRPLLCHSTYGLLSKTLKTFLSFNW
jgi:hypothetical protein